MLAGNSEEGTPATIQVSVASPEVETLPHTPEWGTPAGALPISTREETIVRPIEVCPHCHQDIHEKGYFMDISNGKEYHRDCKGEIVRPHIQNNLDALEFFKKRWGMSEGYYHHCDDPDVLSRTDKPLPLVNTFIIKEALAKSVAERVHRKTRVTSGPSERKLEPVIKRHSDTDPRQTVAGAASLEGSTKKNADKKKARKAAQMSEAVAFVRSNYLKPIDVVIENAAKLDNPVDAIDILEGLNVEKLDKQWIENAIASIKSILEGVDYRSDYYLAVATIDESVSKTEAVLKEDLAKVQKFFPSAWARKLITSDKSMVRYQILTHRGDEYSSTADTNIIC